MAEMWRADLKSLLRLRLQIPASAPNRAAISEVTKLRSNIYLVLLQPAEAALIRWFLSSRSERVVAQVENDDLWKILNNPGRLRRVPPAHRVWHRHDGDPDRGGLERQRTARQTIPELLLLLLLQTLILWLQAIFSYWHDQALLPAWIHQFFPLSQQIEFRTRSLEIHEKKGITVRLEPRPKSPILRHYSQSAQCQNPESNFPA